MGTDLSARMRALATALDTATNRTAREAALYEECNTAPKDSEGQAWRAFLLRRFPLFARGAGNALLSWSLAQDENDPISIAASECLRETKNKLFLPDRSIVGAAPEGLAHLLECEEGYSYFAFYPDNKHLLAISRTQVRTFRISDWSITQSFFLVDTSNPILAARISSDGSMLALLSRRPQIALYDLRTGKQRWAIKSPKQGYTPSLHFARDGKLLLQVTNAKVLTYNTSDGSAQGELKGTSGDLRYSVTTPDGEHLLATGGYKSVKRWKIGTEKYEHSVKIRSPFSWHRTALVPDGSALFQVAGHGAFGEFRLEDSVYTKHHNAEKPPLTNEYVSASELLISADGNCTYTICNDGSLWSWERKTNERKQHHTHISVFEGRGAVSPHGDYIVVSDALNGAAVLRMREENRALEQQWKGVAYPSTLYDLQYRPGRGIYLLGLYVPGTLLLNEETLAIENHWYAPGTVIAPSKDGKRLLSGTAGGSVCLWVENQKERHWEARTPNSTSFVSEVVLDPSEQWALWRMWDRHVCCVEILTGNVLSAKQLPDSYNADAVVLHPDGTQVFVIENERNVQRWLPRTSEQFETILTLPSPVRSLVYAREKLWASGDNELFEIDPVQKTIASIPIPKLFLRAKPLVLAPSQRWLFFPPRLDETRTAFLCDLQERTFIEVLWSVHGHPTIAHKHNALVIAGRDRVLRAFSLTDGKLLTQVALDTEPRAAICDARGRIIVGGQTGRLTRWELS